MSFLPSYYSISLSRFSSGALCVNLGMEWTGLIRGLSYFYFYSHIAIYGPTYRVSFLTCVGLLSGAVVFIAMSGFLMGELWSRREEDEAGHDPDPDPDSHLGSEPGTRKGDADDASYSNSR